MTSHMTLSSVSYLVFIARAVKLWVPIFDPKSKETRFVSRVESEVAGFFVFSHIYG